MRERAVDTGAPTGGDLAIGIVGGIGPAATVQFMHRVLALTPACNEADHLRLLVDCNPKLPDMNAAAFGDGDYALDCLVASGSWLQRAGADLLVVICNAAHCLEDRLRRRLPIPLVSMIGAACDAAKAAGHSHRGIGVLATDGCIRADLYARGLNKVGLEQVALHDGDMPIFLDAVRALKIDEESTAAKEMLDYCAARLVDAGAVSIIVACTEAAIAMATVENRVTYIDPVEELARVVVGMAKRNAGAGNKNLRESACS